MNPIPRELEQELKDANKRLSDYKRWIIENTQHPDFFKIVSDRNYWSVKRDNIVRKIEFAREGKPYLGEPEELTQQVKILTDYQGGKINI